jgi:hypothetical protein
MREVESKTPQNRDNKFSGVVVVFSGATVIGEGVPILNFFCGFCRGKEVIKSLYGDGFLKDSLL